MESIKVTNPLLVEPVSGNPLLEFRNAVKRNFRFDPEDRLLGFYMLNEALDSEIFEHVDIILSGHVKNETSEYDISVQEGIIILLWITATRAPWNFPRMEKYFRLLTRKNKELSEYRSRNLSYILTKARNMSGPLARIIKDCQDENTYKLLTSELMNKWKKEL